MTSPNGPLPSADDDPSLLDALPQPPPTPDSYVPQENEPNNSYLIRRGQRLRQDVAPLHAHVSATVREYFLTEVLPVVSGARSGMLDAIEAVRIGMAEDISTNPETAAYNQLLQHLINTALRAKTTTFVAELTELSPDDELVYRLLDSALSKGKSSDRDIEALMRKLFPVHRVPRPEEARPTRPPLRGLRKDEGVREPPRDFKFWDLGP